MTRITTLVSLLILLCLPCGATAQVYINFKNNPQKSYHDKLHFLRLPLVDDYYGIPGLYQDVTLQYSPETKSLQLTGYVVAEPIEDTTIESVNVIVTNEMPAQVFIVVTGRIDGCSGVGEEVGIKQLGDVFTVYVFHSRYRGTALCAGNAPATQFRKVVPLDVYGLPAKSYSYTLNGKFSGSFTLTAENVLR